MSKTLLFSTGGQPIFLDDLKVIQDYCTEQIRALVFALTGSEEGVYLLRPLGTHTLKGTSTVVYDAVDNFLYRDGELIRISVYENVVSSQDCIVVTEDETAVRTFEDGGQKPCVMYRHARITSAVTEGSYPVSELVVLSDMDVKKWVDVDVQFGIDYSGSVKRLNMDAYDRYWIKATSTDESPRLNNQKVVKFVIPVSIEDVPVSVFPASNTFVYFHPVSDGSGTYLSLSAIGSDSWIPKSTPIDIIIDVPK